MDVNALKNNAGLPRLPTMYSSAITILLLLVVGRFQYIYIFVFLKKR